MRVRVDVSVLPARQIMEGLGVTERGRVQQFLTDRIKFHMLPYMPYLEGNMVNEQTHVTSPVTIYVGADYASYVYEGVSRTGKPLNYTKIEHPKAGPHWDRTMMQEEGDQIAEEVQAYVRSMK
jgi:hypothetical protein